jgi:hypothetical protein
MSEVEVADYQLPAATLLENYLLDSSVGADEDSDPEVSDDVTDRPEATSATRPRHWTRVAIAKQSSSRATTTAEAVKTAKLEAAKKKRKRNTDPAPTSQNVEEEDEAKYELPVTDGRAALSDGEIWIAHEGVNPNGLVSLP